MAESKPAAPDAQPPTPYYQDDLVTLYHGDCREVTTWLQADVLVTDPPYGVAYESNFNRDKRNAKMGRPIAADRTTEARDLALAAWGERPALVFGRWDAPKPERVHTRLIWDKGNSVGMGNLSIPWGRSDEEIYVIGSGFTGKRSGSILRVQMLMSGDAERPDHPTPKPVTLMELLIQKTTGVVADPFVGSGSTLIAAGIAYVYVISTDAFDVLYVGKTVNPAGRLSSHRHGKPWWPASGNLTILAVGRESKAEADAAAFHLEKLAIRDLRPIHNIAGVMA